MAEDGKVTEETKPEKPKRLDLSRLEAGVQGLIERTQKLIVQTHIGRVLTFAAVLEEELRAALDSHMAHKSNKMSEKLYDQSGPLATFSAKIKVAHAFGVIPSDLAAELDKIRNIRNRFAHTREAISFQTPEIIEAVSKLSTAAKDKETDKTFNEAVISALRGLAAAKKAEKGAEEA